MEEGQREEELLPGPRLGARVEAVLRHVVVAAVDVGLHALGRLIGQLDAVLQHQHREDRRGHGGEPEPEVGVRLGRLQRQLLHHRLHVQHPALGEVAVVQAHPVTLGRRLLHHHLRDAALPLAQRDHVQPLAGRPAHLLRKALQHRGGVGASGEDEDDGGAAVGVLKHVLQPPGRGLRERASHGGLHVLGDSKHHLLRAQQLDDHELVEWRGQRLLPAQRQRRLLRLLQLRVRAPRAVLPAHRLNDAGKAFDVRLHVAQAGPRLGA
mmetsp:Transcript_27175/g.68386  ORF Transcript_27175/g.68386 Transcript_27175/m.68386 type:complete len:266 (+) Transcript_27175:1603-2400(+)